MTYVHLLQKYVILDKLTFAKFSCEIKDELQLMKQSLGFFVFDRKCPARGPIPDSSLLLHQLFMKLIQLTIDGTEFGTEVPPGGIVWH